MESARFAENMEDPMKKVVGIAAAGSMVVVVTEDGSIWFVAQPRDQQHHEDT
jgi:hypothetical protein